VGVDVGGIEQRNTFTKYCWKLFHIFSTFKDGWRIFIRQEIALVGFSLASIYLTVLGFSGVTSAYFLTQGVSNGLIGLFQGVGALFGVFGTFLYPVLRKRFGTVRTGLFGISTQLLLLTFCIAAVVIPSSKASSPTAGYYSPDCRNETEIDNVDISMDTVVCSPTISPSQTYSFPSASIAPAPSDNCTSPSSLTAGGSGTNIGLILMLVGVVACRIGLWTFDLAVQQLIQEKVVEEERGVVSGVINAMIAIMDMMHYVMVIAAPRPEHFRALTVISFVMVFVGWLFYGVYVRKSRGHFFHFKDFSNFVLRKKKANQVFSSVAESDDIL
jgi:iron-regulated transporter 1